MKSIFAHFPYITKLNGSSAKKVSVKISPKNNSMKISKNKPDNSPAMSAIADGTKFTGDIEATNPIRIDGELKGNISSKSKIVLGERSLVSGDIEGEEIVVAGTVNGMIKASSTVILKPESRVDGELVAKEFIIEAGARFNGTCSMSEMKPTMVLEAKQA